VQRNTLGSSNLEVSEIGLGTLNFGCQIAETSAFGIMDAAHEGGVTLVDTADVYPA
jgi:aryl-alcohol dehydrogenase-like predicted oxidoreductase